MQTKLAINQPGDEYEQRAELGEERRSAPLSHPVAPDHEFNFSRLPVTAMPIQRKPTVSFPGDVFEREADDVAEKVMRMIEPTPIGSAPASLQRKCKRCEEREEEAGQSTHAPSVVAQRTSAGATARSCCVASCKGRGRRTAACRPIGYLAQSGVRNAAAHQLVSADHGTARQTTIQGRAAPGGDT